MRPMAKLAPTMPIATVKNPRGTRSKYFTLFLYRGEAAFTASQGYLSGVAGPGLRYVAVLGFQLYVLTGALVTDQGEAIEWLLPLNVLLHVSHVTGIPKCYPVLLSMFK